MNESQIREILLEAINEKTGWGNPLRANCECEDLYLCNIVKNPDGTLIVDFRYIFDEDGWSQYDTTHVFEGSIKITNEKDFELEMENIHVGIAAVARSNLKLK